MSISEMKKLNIKDKDGQLHEFEVVDSTAREEAAKVMTGATEDGEGESGRVPAPQVGDQEKFLSGDGTWRNVEVPPGVSASYNETDEEVIITIGG